MSERKRYMIEKSYLIKKIHLHVVKCEMTPPRIGPRTPEQPRVMPTIAEVRPIFSGETTSGSITMVIENKPDPPTPCNARNAILDLSAET
jgi:hypothetical protein